MINTHEPSGKPGQAPLFTAVADLLVEAYEIEESTRTK